MSKQRVVVSRGAVARRACAVCGSRACGPDEIVCARCMDNPGVALEHHAVAVQAAIRALHEAAREAESAWAALTPAERERWGVFALARQRVARGEERDPHVVARVNATLRAYEDPDDQRVPEALRAYFAADERLFWANGALEGRQQQYERARHLLHDAIIQRKETVHAEDH